MLEDLSSIWLVLQQFDSTECISDSLKLSYFDRLLITDPLNVAADADICISDFPAYIYPEILQINSINTLNLLLQ